jgi:hypothetical protein
MTQGETLEELEDNMKDAFTDVADGTFYVVIKINWNVQGGIQGGSIMKSVTLSRGSKAEVTLSP